MDVKHYKGMKLVCAIALLRMKPPHLSGKEYAESLHAAYWKMVLCSKLYETKLDVTNSGDVNLTQSIITSKRKEETITLASGSCNLKKSVLTSQALLSHLPEGTCHNERGLNHDWLDNVEKRAFDQALVICSALTHALEEVTAFVSPSLSDLMLTATDTLCNILRLSEKWHECENTSRKNKKLLIKVVDETMKLVEKLLIKSFYSETVAATVLYCKVLQKLLQSHKLKFFVGHRLVQSIVTLSDTLDRTIDCSNQRDGKFQYNFNVFKNSSYLFQLLETFICSNKQQLSAKYIADYETNLTDSVICGRSNPAKSITCSNDEVRKYREFLLSAHESLKVNFFNLSSHFPLFECYIFKLRFLIEKMLFE